MNLEKRCGGARTIWWWWWWWCFWCGGFRTKFNLVEFPIHVYVELAGRAGRSKGIRVNLEKRCGGARTMVVAVVVVFLVWWISD